MDDVRLKEIDAAVTCTLTKLGFELSDPIAVQSDMHFLRSLRQRTEAVGTRVITLLAGIITLGIAGGAIAALAKAVKEAVT